MMIKTAIGISLSLIICAGFACKTVKQNFTQKISIANKKIFINKTPYYIKGICYHPVEIGETTRNFKQLDKDLTLMREAGINTIRVYQPIDNKEVLDKIHNAGIKLIIGIGYNQDGNFDILTGTYLDYIEKYKNHPAILIWELGNEYNYHPEWFGGDIQNWYNAINSASKAIKQIDSNHLVSTAHGEMPSRELIAALTDLDIWGLNIYRWDQPQTVFQEWKSLTDKPVYLSESGADSYMKISKAGFEEGVNQNAQAKANATIIDSVFKYSHLNAGMVIFSFTDGWWKAGNPNKQDVGGWAPNSSGVPYDGAPNEEYWGIVDIYRNKKQTFDTIKKRFNSFPLNHK